MHVCTIRDTRAIHMLPAPEDGTEMAVFSYLAQDSSGNLTPPGVTLRRGRPVWFDDVEFERGRRLVAHVNYALLWSVLNQDSVPAFRVFDVDGLALYDGERLWCLSPDVTVYEADQIKSADDLLSLLKGAHIKAHDRATLYAAHTSGNWRLRFFDQLLLVDAVETGGEELVFTPTYAALDAAPLSSGSVAELVPKTAQKGT